MPRLSLQYFWNKFACLFLSLLLAAGAQGDEWAAYDSKLSGNSNQTAIFEAFAKKVPAGPKMVRSQSPAKRAVGKPRMKWGGIRSVRQVKSKRNTALAKQSGKQTSATKFRKKNFGRNSKSLAQRRVTPPKRVTRAFRNSPAAKTKGTSKSRSALPYSKSSKQVPAYLQRKMKSSDALNKNRQKGKPETKKTQRYLNFSPRSMNKKYDKHAHDFGITGNRNTQKLGEFRKAIVAHVSHKDTKIIEGTYRKTQKVTHFYNSKTGLNVMRDANGDFLSGWRLSKSQARHLLEHGNVQ